ncbi:IS630 family transposase [bacterium]|nr:IS630 family transposase [bacterium]
MIFLDESGANLQMAPLYGRGYGGERVIKAVPFNRGSRFTMLSAISFTKVEAALYGEWAADGEIFLKFIEKCLCPVLQRRHIVIMDNVAFHKVCGVKEAIESKGAKLIYLPPYSPDLNPIEHMWSKIKTCLRKESARTLGKFASAIKVAFTNVNAVDLKNWYVHCGY